MINLTLTQY